MGLWERIQKREKRRLGRPAVVPLTLILFRDRGGFSGGTAVASIFSDSLHTIALAATGARKIGVVWERERGKGRISKSFLDSVRSQESPFRATTGIRRAVCFSAARVAHIIEKLAPKAPIELSEEKVRGWLGLE